jgi:predicted GNAT superfamily acetyltransferase
VSDVAIRPLRTHEELQACVELQRATWGREFTELVPPSLLYAVQKVGGVAAGAFDAAGRLLGFVFGFSGTRAGQLVHWSDMVAVRADAQGRGIGPALKEYQRAEVARLGVTAIYWTYDPLVAKNAHLNFNHYGVEVAEYVQDLYGADTRSVLHRGLGTDRFVVVWRIGPGAGAPRRGGGTPSDVPVEVRDAAIVNAGTAEGSDAAPERFASAPPPVLRVEIPRDVAAVQATSLDLAGRWRATTRRAFVWGLASGYAVTGFYRDDAAGRGYYVLTRT